LVFPEAVESSETILAECRKWAERIGESLSKKSVEGAKVRLTLEDEDGALRVFARSFSKPIQCPRTALAALLLMLDGKLDRPILSMRLLITELKKVRAYQADLMQHVKDERRIDKALSQIRTVFGSESVRLGREIPEPRRVKVLREWKSAIGWQ